MRYLKRFEMRIIPIIPESKTWSTPYITFIKYLMFINTGSTCASPDAKSRGRRDTPQKILRQFILAAETTWCSCNCYKIKNNQKKL